MRSPAPTRRALLLGASTLSVGMMCGCVPSPTIRGGRAAEPVAAATPDTALVQARADERALVGLLSTAVAGTGKRTPAQTTALRQLLAAHTTHLRVLERPDPLQAGASAQPEESPTPSGAPGADWAALAGRIGALEKTAQQHHRAAAQTATDGPMALLYASLSTFAGLNTVPGRPIAVGRTTPARVEVGSRTEALDVLLSRLRALAEGLEIGLGQVPSTDKVVEPMRKHLAEVWAARDRVAAQLWADKREVPPAELGYVMPGGFSSVAEARKTWAALEDGVTAGWARVAAASTGTQREQGLDAMLAQARVALAMGAPLTRWPGWV
ncbi:DUF4439 domain-containing protein [Luteococcus sp. OSA5]|uniref:DUF4439 domain-containing protein n=1 Tax=Luteococcus sp. OSA5 TaxID=3401630 RepID=UPI003B433FF8